MGLEDACASELRHREEKLELHRLLQSTQEQLALALRLQQLQTELSDGVQSQFQSKFEDVLITAQKLGMSPDLTPSKLPNSEIQKAAQLLKEKEMNETVVTTELRQLKRHIENLSNQKLNSLNGNWEVEIPAFCKNLLQVFSSLMQPKAQNSELEVSDMMKVTCSAGELHGVVNRLLEILEEFEQCGDPKEFGIQLGRLSVSVIVEGDSTSDLCCYPQQLASALSSQITCNASLTDRPAEPKQCIDQLAYIHQLEEKLVEMQAALACQSEPIEVESNQAELESKLEEMMYKLALASKQIEKLKQGKYSPDEERIIQNYKLKAAEVVLREENIKEVSSRLAFEREKFQLEIDQFDKAKEEMFAEHENAMSELALAYTQIQRPTSEIAIQAESDPRIQELEQTCRQLAQQLQEEMNKSRLLIETQQVMRKEEGHWIHLGSGRAIVKQIQNLNSELAKGIEVDRIPKIQKCLKKMTDKLELLCSKQINEDFSGSEDGKPENSIFSLSNEDSSEAYWSNSPVQPSSPHFSMSRIDHQEDFNAEIKLKDEQIEQLKQKVEELEKNENCLKSESEELKSERVLLLKKDNELQSLKATIEEFMSIRILETKQLEENRLEIAKEKAIIEEEKENFRHKRTLLREKVEEVNERQKKLQDKEKLLAEKQTLLLLQEKKMDCHKQAIDEEWARIDEKRHEVLKCHKIIDDEWKVLMEETKQFEILKLADKRLKAEFTENQKTFESDAENWSKKIREIESEREKFEIQKIKFAKEKEIIEREKAKIRAEQERLEEERNQLVRAKKVLYEKMKQCQLEKSEMSLDRMSVAKQKKDNEENRRDLALMIPALQKLINHSRASNISL